MLVAHSAGSEEAARDLVRSDYGSSGSILMLLGSLWHPKGSTFSSMFETFGTGLKSENCAAAVSGAHFRGFGRLRDCDFVVLISQTNYKSPSKHDFGRLSSVQAHLPWWRRGSNKLPPVQNYIHMHIFDISCIRLNLFILYSTEIFLNNIYSTPSALCFTKALHLAVADGSRRLLTEHNSPHSDNLGLGPKPKVVGVREVVFRQETTTGGDSKSMQSVHAIRSYPTNSNPIPSIQSNPSNPT